MTIFEKHIEPILLYGSSLFGLPECNKHIKIVINNMEGRVKEQIKNILVALINRNVPIESVRTNRSKMLPMSKYQKCQLCRQIRNLTKRCTSLDRIGIIRFYCVV